MTYSDKASHGRIRWVDSLRGICMIAILLDHTESYYLDYHVINQNLYLTDALYLFFAISGYLMYREGRNVELSAGVRSVARSLLMPYAIFTTLLAVPKAIANQGTVDASAIVRGILLGQASWFVAALIVGKLLFLLLEKASRGNIIIMALGSIAAFAASFPLAGCTASCVWQADNALQSMLFLFIGYAYRRYECRMSCCNAATALLLAVFVVIKIYVAARGVTMAIWHINVSDRVVFVANVAVGVLAMFALFRRLPPCRMAEWTGRHCIVYYFLCGGVPLVVGRLALRMGFAYGGNYLRVLAVFVVVYAITTMLTWAIYRYVPFITGVKQHKSTLK